jgi:hypothetical protein
MDKKGLTIGLVVGFITNIIGFFLAAYFLGKGDSFINMIKIANAQGFLSKLISLGAILNLITFFYFLRKRQDSRARGVLIATILTAILTLVFKFL